MISNLLMNLLPYNCPGTQQCKAGLLDNVRQVFDRNKDNISICGPSLKLSCCSCIKECGLPSGSSRHSVTMVNDNITRYLLKKNVQKLEKCQKYRTELIIATLPELLQLTWKGNDFTDCVASAKSRILFDPGKGF
jgi:hypothetical protein